MEFNTNASLITESQEFHPMSLSPWDMLNVIPFDQEFPSQELFCPPQEHLVTYVDFGSCHFLEKSYYLRDLGKRVFVDLGGLLRGTVKRKKSGGFGNLAALTPPPPTHGDYKLS